MQAHQELYFAGDSCRCRGCGIANMKPGLAPAWAHGLGKAGAGDGLQLQVSKSLTAQTADAIEADYWQMEYNIVTHMTLAPLPVQKGQLQASRAVQGLPAS